MPRGPDWNDAVAGKCAPPPADAAEGEGMTWGAISPKFGRGSRGAGRTALLANRRNSSQPAAASTTGRPASNPSANLLRVMPCLKLSSCIARSLAAVLDFTVRPYSLPNLRPDAESGTYRRRIAAHQNTLSMGLSPPGHGPVLPFIGHFPSGLKI